MTKEEQLKQEAEEYAEGMAKYYASTHEDCIPSQFEKYLRNAYISSAEPREKQIQIDAEQILALQKQNGELTDKVKELEHQLTHRNCVDCSNHSSKLRMRTLDLEKENAELKHQLGNLYEIIKRPYQFTAPRKIQMVKEAKQFLNSEVEK